MSNPITLDILTRAQLDALKKTIGAMGKLGDQLDGINRFGEQLTRTLAAAFTVKRLVEYTQRAVDLADEAGKLAQKVGFSVRAISEIGYAAKLANVGAGELEVGLKQLNQKITDAASGNKDAEATFAALGVKVRDANGQIRSSESIFLDVAKAFEEMEAGAGKTSIAVDIFGRSGTALIPLLNEGKKGIAAMREEAKKFGVSIGEETAQDAEDFNDSITKLKEVTSGLFLSFAQDILPTLKVFTSIMIDASSETGTMNTIASTLGFTVKVLAAGITIIGAALTKVGTVIGFVSAAAYETVKLNFEEAGDILLQMDQRIEEIDLKRDTAVADIFSPQKRGGQADSAPKKEAPNINAAKQLEAANQILEKLRQATIEASEDRIAILNRETYESLKLAEKSFTDKVQLEEAKNLIIEGYAQKKAKIDADITENEHKEQDKAKKQFEKDIEDRLKLIRKLEELGRQIEVSGIASRKRDADSNPNLSPSARHEADLKYFADKDAWLQKEIARNQEIMDSQGGEAGMQAKLELVHLQLQLSENQRDQKKEEQNTAPNFQGVHGFAHQGLNDQGELIAPYEKLDQFLTGTLQGTFDSLSASISGWITGTRTWGEVWTSFQNRMIEGVVNLILEYTLFHSIRMLLDRIFNTTAQKSILTTKAVGSAAQTASAAESAVTGAATAAAWSPAAILASIGSYGVAGIVGLAVVLAALGALAAGAFEEGGYTGAGGKSQPAGIVHKGEFVVPADVTAAMGPDSLYSMMDSVRMGRPMDGYAGGGLVMPPGATSRFNPNINVSASRPQVIVVDGEEAAKKYLQSFGGRADISRIVDGQRIDLGIS